MLLTSTPCKIDRKLPAAQVTVCVLVMGDTIEKYRSNRYFCNYIRYRLLSITKKSIVKMIAITLRMRINNTRGFMLHALSELTYCWLCSLSSTQITAARFKIAACRASLFQSWRAYFFKA